MEILDEKETMEEQNYEENTQDNDGIKCPICFTEYTSTGIHRVSSLKCGHLFGYGCILEWYDKRRVVLCPICGIKCPKSQLRIIFSSKIVSFNTDNVNKLHDQYIAEINKNKKLLEEICSLRTEIDVLKLNNKTHCQCQVKKVSDNLFMDFIRKTKLSICTKSAILIYDEIDDSIVISSTKNNIPTIFKYVNCDISLTKSFNSSLRSYINNLKLNEGNLYLSIDKNFYVINNYNFNTIYTETLNNRITALEVHNKDRDLVLFADDRGFIILNIIGISLRTIKICKEPIHSLVLMENKAYIGTVYNVYSITPNCSWRDFVNSNEDFIIDKVSLNDVKFDKKMCCINIFGHDNTLVITYRLCDNNIIHYFLIIKLNYLSTWV
ncbi:e3 ubiquitin-protein ligase rfwd3 [Vairimorpha apis BRL 01]|uniref:E3 ubiquitin-protein ligase rfwd3 n=1 Tax=Vairimorpha apis BRL 01 TaxID=1037528 RepID=T0MLX0_9MICR|nr:e3 ubiquitin-protein ligase rfwd3 [Vairimorpha apis BRL 01]